MEPIEIYVRLEESDLMMLSRGGVVMMITTRERERDREREAQRLVLVPSPVFVHS